jgi:hypothetical protein
MNGPWVDLKIALHVFVKSPVFAGIVVLTLALGSGASSAIFSLMDQLTLRLLPMERPYRLVVLGAPRVYSGSTSSQSQGRTPMRVSAAGETGNVGRPPTSSKHGSSRKTCSSTVRVEDVRSALGPDAIGQHVRGARADLLAALGHE